MCLSVRACAFVHVRVRVRMRAYVCVQSLRMRVCVRLSVNALVRVVAANVDAVERVLGPHPQEVEAHLVERSRAKHDFFVRLLSQQVNQTRRNTHADTFPCAHTYHISPGELHVH